MKAAIIREYGSPDVFHIADVDGPGEPGPKDVRLKVHASSVNPIDWKIRKGTQRAFIRYNLPWILGLDVSGTVEAVGSKVTRFKPGDEVFGSVNYKRPGCYAERTLVAADELALKPSNLTHEEAASVPLVALTAWQSLVDKGRMKAGQKVFIQAGSGGVGTMAIQIAKHFDTEVTTTCSSRNVDMVRELGADHVVDYTSDDFSEVVRNQDLLLDSLGGEARWKALPCLKRGGRHVSIVSDIPPHVQKYGAIFGTLAAVSKLGWFKVVARFKYGVKAHMVVQWPNGDQLAQIGQIIEEGKILPRVDRVYALDEISEAHRYSETGRAQGKIVLAVA